MRKISSKTITYKGIGVDVSVWRDGETHTARGDAHLAHSILGRHAPVITAEPFERVPGRALIACAVDLVQQRIDQMAEVSEDQPPMALVRAEGMPGHGVSRVGGTAARVAYRVPSEGVSVATYFYLPVSAVSTLTRAVSRWAEQHRLPVEVVPMSLDNAEHRAEVARHFDGPMAVPFHFREIVAREQ